jgi:hypothetical protein
VNPAALSRATVTHMRARKAMAAAVVAGWSVALLAGCGGADTSGDTGAVTSAGAPAPVGGGLSVAEAKATAADPPLAVGGRVVVVDGTPRLCSGYEPDADPSCLEPSLEVVGGDRVADGTAVILLGAVEGDRFVVDSRVNG